MSRKSLPWILALVAALTGVSPPALADRVAQSRRARHFEVLHQRGVFQSMSIVDGLPTLTLTELRSQVEPESLRAFCRIIFDYYVESNPRFSELRVVDAATGRLLAIISRDGYRDAP